MERLVHLEQLTDSFRHLPGVGQKSAERMALAVLNMNEEDVETFAQALNDVLKYVHHCPICGLYTENDGPCDICRDQTRDHHLCIVVSDPRDTASFEKIDGFNGVYHVLGGVLSASGGISAADLNIDGLFKRIEEEKISEIIIATNPTIEGETTALYLARLLEKYTLKVTRLGYGLPMGGHLDYADALTLKKAIAGRTDMKGNHQE